MLDDSVPFLLRAGQKSGHVFKGDQRNIERVAETHEPRAFHRGVDVQNTREKRGLIGDDAHRLPTQPRESHHDIFCKMLVDLEEIIVIGDGVNHVLDVIRLHRIGGNDANRARRRRASIGSEVGRRGGSSRLLSGRKLISSRIMARHSASSRRDEMGDAAGGVVRHGAAQVLLWKHLRASPS